MNPHPPTPQDSTKCSSLSLWGTGVELRATGNEVSSPSPRPSPRGRGNCFRPFLLNTRRRKGFRQPKILPLPAGEGWGEGPYALTTYLNSTQCSLRERAGCVLETSRKPFKTLRFSRPKTQAGPESIELGNYLRSVKFMLQRTMAQNSPGEAVSLSSEVRPPGISA